MKGRDSVKRNGLRFLSLYSTTLLDVTGEDSVLFNWKRVVKSIKCGGKSINCGKHGFLKHNYSLMRDFDNNGGRCTQQAPYNIYTTIPELLNAESRNCSAIVSEELLLRRDLSLGCYGERYRLLVLMGRNEPHKLQKVTCNKTYDLTFFPQVQIICLCLVKV